MSKLRRNKAMAKYRSVQCRGCGRATEVLDGSKLGYDAAQWQCLQCGHWNRFAAGVGELTAQGTGGSPKPAVATAAMSAPHRGHRIEVLRVVEPENGSARFVIQWE